MCSQQAVVTVALGGESSSFADQPLKLWDRQSLRGLSPRHVKDVFLHDSAMQIVCSVGKRYLCDADLQPDPISGLMRDIIEVKTAHCERPQIFLGRAAADVREPVCIGLEGEGNEAGEAAGLILQAAELVEVGDAVGVRLGMSVEHRAGATTAQLMPDAMHLQPLFCAFLGCTDLDADRRIENLCASACQ